MSTLSFNQLAKNSIGDFFHLPSNYDRRIAKYTNLHLREQEGVKTRQIYGNLCSIANGMAFSVPTHGTSLVVCTFAARRLPFLKRDWMIPVAVAVTAASITWGVDLGVSQIVPVNQLLPVVDPDNMLGNAPCDQLTQHAGHVFSDVATHTAIEQSGQYGAAMPVTHSGLNTISHQVHAATAGFEAGARDQIASLFGQQIPQPISNPLGPNDPALMAMLMGYKSGAAAAVMTEHAVTSQVGGMALQFTSDKIDFESLKRRTANSLACRRLPWSTRVVCQECVMPIESGVFFHCCGGNDFGDEDDDPDDDEYDVCWPCYNNLKNDDFKARLRTMYLAVPGDSFHPGLNAVTLVDLLGPKTLLCMACDGNITNGWYYDCWDCRSLDKRWTFCGVCYREGGGCARNRTHRLFSFPRTRIANFDINTPYQKKVPKGTKETGRAACTKCHANIERGAYYHCAKCDKGNFVLCTRCHASEKHCWNSSHVLTKYYAWKYKRDYDTVPAAKWQCSNPDCLNLFDMERDREGGTGRAEEIVGEALSHVGGEKKEKKKWSIIVSTKEKKKEQTDHEVSGKRMKFKFFFSCRESSCHNREYGLCPPCYFTDLTCPIKEHDMYKCYFVK